MKSIYATRYDEAAYIDIWKHIRWYYKEKLSDLMLLSPSKILIEVCSNIGVDTSVRFIM